jgi:hypothetical protein
VKIRIICKMIRSRASNRGISRALNSVSLMVVLFMLTSLDGFAQQPIPSLEETATWLQNAYANHGSYSYGNWSIHGSLAIVGCAAKMTTSRELSTNDGTYTTTSTWVEEVSLGDLDPDSVRATNMDAYPSVGLDQIAARDGRASVKFTAIVRSSSSVMTRSSVSWGCDDADFAKRIQVALKHAITLCGGKSSTF